MGGLVLIYLLKFATDVLLIAPALVGAVFGAARLWDAVSDPLAGHWSDRTLHRLGRRRPWLFVSALLLPLGFVALWVPPTGLGAVALTVWFAVCVFFLHTALTVFEIPHRALGAELSPEPHDRTRVFAASTFVTHIGGVAAIACVGLLERADDPRSAALPIAVGVALATGALIALGAWRTPEPPEHRGRGGASLRSAFRDIGREPFARAVLGARFVQQIGLASTLSLLPFVSDYLVGTPGWTAYYLASAVTGLLLAIPVWVALSRRLGKVACWKLSAWINLVLFAGFFTCGQGDGLWILGGIFFAGAAGACSGVVAPSLLADVVDRDERRSGERKEGAYFAAWAFAEKSALGVKMVVVGAMLQFAGFEPNADQGQTALTGLRIAVAGVPCIGMVVALWMLGWVREGDKLRGRLRAGELGA
jgi:GPH family glycoside/pentoside/hexuronide:cation symporter